MGQSLIMAPPLVVAGTPQTIESLTLQSSHSCTASAVCLSLRSDPLSLPRKSYPTSNSTAGYHFLAYQHHYTESFLSERNQQRHRCAFYAFSGSFLLPPESSR